MTFWRRHWTVTTCGRHCCARSQLAMCLRILFQRRPRVTFKMSRARTGQATLPVVPGFVQTAGSVVQSSRPTRGARLRTTGSTFSVWRFWRVYRRPWS